MFEQRIYLEIIFIRPVKSLDEHVVNLLMHFMNKMMWQYSFMFMYVHCMEKIKKEPARDQRNYPVLESFPAYSTL